MDEIIEYVKLRSSACMIQLPFPFCYVLVRRYDVHFGSTFCCATDVGSDCDCDREGIQKRGRQTATRSEWRFCANKLLVN